MSPPLRNHKNNSQTSPVITAFQQHIPALKRYIYRILANSNDIEDVAQEAFLLAYSAEKPREIIWTLSPVIF
ncbi:MAG: hypothetical protein GYB33_02700 [Gammaproteobacteria bacterium]|nr:hypothetical protein [Gammaproteobacteria bacterium]